MSKELINLAISKALRVTAVGSTLFGLVGCAPKPQEKEKNLPTSTVTPLVEPYIPPIPESNLQPYQDEVKVNKENVSLKAESIKWPEINKEEIPQYLKDILDLTPITDMGSDGILKFKDQNMGINKFINVPLHQSYINTANLKASETREGFKFVNAPICLVFHWFGNTPGWESAYTPNKSAKEYIDQGFGNNTSAMFLVGDEKLTDDPNALDLPVSIVQSELPDKNGTPIYSAHTLGVDKNIYRVANEQYFVSVMSEVMYKYGFKDYFVHSVLQQLYNKGYNSSPNLQCIGIEILGNSFYTEGHIPSEQKVANVLGVSMALIKHYNISSPAYNSYGHLEIDMRKGDPGNKFVFLMKTLIGIQTLLSHDKEMANIVFGPFLTDKKNPKEAVIRYFDFIADYYRGIDSPSSVNDWLTTLGYDKVMQLIENTTFPSDFLTP